MISVLRRSTYLQSGHHEPPSFLKHFFVGPVRMVELHSIGEHVVPFEQQYPKRQQSRVLITPGISQYYTHTQAISLG